MGISCDCDYGDYAEFQSSKGQNARKQYVCLECRQTINIGDYYIRTFGKIEGDVYQTITCERCDDLMAAFAAVGYCYTHGEFLQEYHEWLQESQLKIPAWLLDIRQERVA